MIFYCNNGYANAPQCYIDSTLCVLFGGAHEKQKAFREIKFIILLCMTHSVQDVTITRFRAGWPKHWVRFPAGADLSLLQNFLGPPWILSGSYPPLCPRRQSDQYLKPHQSRTSTVNLDAVGCCETSISIYKLYDVTSGGLKSLYSPQLKFHI